jgi:hypothetical protein
LKTAPTPARRSIARRIVGWSCIALGKVASLLLLWALIASAEPDLSDDAAGMDVVLGLFGIAPLLVITLGTVAIGLWILLGSQQT